MASGSDGTLDAPLDTPLSSGDDEVRIDDLDLPAPWPQIDRWIVRLSLFTVLLIGLGFLVTISIEVLARVFLGTSVAEANSVSRFLLVWFFMVGASLALRKSSHVSVDFFIKAFPARLRLVCVSLSQMILLGFFILMLVSGWLAFEASLNQRDAALQVTVGWGVMALPVGFGLMIYHQLALLTEAVFRPSRER